MITVGLTTLTRFLCCRGTRVGLARECRWRWSQQQGGGALRFGSIGEIQKSCFLKCDRMSIGGSKLTPNFFVADCRHRMDCRFGGCASDCGYEIWISTRPGGIRLGECPRDIQDCSKSNTRTLPTRTILPNRKLTSRIISHILMWSTTGFFIMADRWPAILMMQVIYIYAIGMSAVIQWQYIFQWHFIRVLDIFLRPKLIPFSGVGKWTSWPSRLRIVRWINHD